MPAIVADGRTMGERPGLICGLVAGSEPDAVTDEHSDAVWMGLRSVEECAVVVDETRIGSAAACMACCCDATPAAAASPKNKGLRRRQCCQRPERAAAVTG